MLLMSASCVSGLSRSQRATGAGILPHRADVTCSSSRTTRRPASAIWRRSRATRTFSSRSSCLTSPRRAARMNEFSCAGSFSVHGAWRARKRNVANAAGARRSGAAAPAPAAAAGARRQTTDTAPSTGTRGRAASARARTRAGSAARPRRARSPRATGPRSKEPSVNGSAMPSASAKCRLRRPRSRPSRTPASRKALDGIDADDGSRLLGERQRHAAAAAAGVEHAAADRDAGALEKCDHLGAAVVLEQRVVVLGPEPEVRVRLDGALVNRSHGPSRARTCR